MKELPLSILIHLKAFPISAFDVSISLHGFKKYFRLSKEEDIKSGFIYWINYNILQKVQNLLNQEIT